jgi:hypothetical protein
MESDALRQIKAIQKLDDEQILIAYSSGYTNPNIDAYNPVVKIVLEGRLLTRVASETNSLAIQVERLSVSSERMELLTKAVKRWTVWLMVVGIIQILFIVVQTWKAFQPERPLRVVVEAPRNSATQPSVRPSR